jgi:hypothetical protein
MAGQGADANARAVGQRNGGYGEGHRAWLPPRLSEELLISDRTALVQRRFRCAYIGDAEHVGRAWRAQRNAGGDDDAVAVDGESFLLGDAQARSTMSSRSCASGVTTQWVPQTIDMRRAVFKFGDNAMIGTVGRSRAARRPVVPVAV